MRSHHSLRESKRYCAELREHRGIPTVHVNGEPFHIGAVMHRNVPGSESPYRNEIPSLAAINPTVVMAFSSFDVGPDPNFFEIEKWFERAFTKHKRALGACHIGLQPSADWVRANPDEMTVYDREVDWSEARQPEASWASHVWRRDSAKFVESLVRHLDRAFSGRVVLYQIGGGSCHENSPIANPMTGHYVGGWYCGDFSHCMRRYFQDRLRRYYDNRLQSLRKAWGDKHLTFETATVPDRMERLRSEWFTFRSPRRSQSADYHRAWSQAVEDCVLLWAKAAKRGTQRRALVACPIGSILDCGLNVNLILHSTKNTFARALRCNDLDMFESPASYAHRDPGRGDTSAMIPLGTVRLAGKTWLRDFDSRTSLTLKNANHSAVSGLWQPPRTTWEDQQLLLRDAGYSFIQGGSYWWHEIEAGMYSDPLHLFTVRRLERIGRKAMDADRSAMPGLGVFVDHEANFHQANTNRLIYAMNYEARQLRWSHAGLASQVYHLDDAGHRKMPAHRVLMVTNAFVISDRQVADIKRLARRNKAIVIWLIAPGLQTKQGFDVNRASRIAGFKLRSVNIEASPQISLLHDAHPWCRAKDADGKRLKRFGSGPREDDESGSRSFGPMFYADVSKDPAVTVLGNLDVVNQPGLVTRQMDGYTSVYCAAPYLHQGLLREIGRTAGAHLYHECNDLVHVNKQLLLLHAVTGGPKELRWPRRFGQVIDLWKGKRVAAQSHKWSVTMKPKQTCLFFVGSDKDAAEIIHA